MNQPQLVQFSAVPPQYSAPPLQKKLVSQVCGTIIAVILALITGKGVLDRFIGAFKINVGSFLFINQCIHFTSDILRLFFFIEMVRRPEFLAGKPSAKKFIVLYIDLFINLVRIFILVCFARIPARIYNPIVDITLESLFFILSMAMYNHDDSQGSCCLCLKPWAYREIVQMNVIPDKTMPVSNVNNNSSNATNNPNVSSNPYATFNSNATNNQSTINYPTRSYPYPGYNQPLQPQP